MKKKLKDKKLVKDVFLEGKKIYLRGLLKKDISIWYKWFNDCQVTKLMDKGFYPNTKQIQESHLNHLVIFIMYKRQNNQQLAI